MALFSRRTIQRELDFLRPKILRPDREKDVLGKLNSHNRQALETEWEIVILAALARLADVTHEQLFGSRHPDIFLQGHCAEDHFQFLADIVTVSDHNNEKENPADFFFQEFDRIAAKAGLCGGFDIEIGEHTTGKDRNKTNLLLPPKGDIPKFIRNELTPFFREIAAEPSIPCSLECNQSRIQVRITYDPKQRGHTTGGYAFSASPRSLMRNPLSRALDDKATQLRETGYDGLLGVIVTDGGCHALVSRSSGLGVFSRDKLVEHFLQKHPRIGFVTTSHHETRGGYPSLEEKLFHKIYLQRSLSPETKSKVYELFKVAFKSLPTTASSPRNAWIDIRDKREISKGRKLGAYHWRPPTSLTVSSRSLLALLATTLTKREFELLFYHQIPAGGGPLIHFFRSVLESHLTISRASLHRAPQDDDDWVTFEIGTSEMRDTSRKSSATILSCDVSLMLLVRYFAGLDYSLGSGKTNYSYLATIPNEIRAFVRQMESEGRMLVNIQVTREGSQLRLTFGDRDAAISPYF